MEQITKHTMTQHTWSFARIGGFEQVRLNQAEDLQNLEQLDRKLWAALSCPTEGLFFDKQTLALIDEDQDGRVRVPEVLAAVRWCCQVLRDPNLLLSPADNLPLNALDTETEAGQSLYAAAHRLLELLGRPNDDIISLPDVTEQQNALAQARFNGDGIILPGTSETESVQQVIQTIMDCIPPVEDISGAKGINKASVESFYAALEARLAWLNKAEPNWVPEGVDAKLATDSIEAVRIKIDDYFSRCRASQFDTRATEHLNRSAKDWAELTHQTLSASAEELANFPLALVQPELKLPLRKGLNPAWDARIQTLYQAVIQPVLGDTEFLEYNAWQNLKAQFDEYQNWLNEEAGQAVAALTQEQLEALKDDPAKDEILNLIAQDEAVKPLVDALTQVETLLRYRLNLVQLLNNFVNFTEFYHPNRRAVFEAGTLYLDGRACELCIEVHDPAKHATLAGLSNCFLAYLDCTRKDGAKKTIVAAFTGGDPDNLLVGRNGVFYDREGNDWDATITRLVENPMSIRQAFFSPYKRFIRFLEAQAAKNAEEAEAKGQTAMQKKVTEPNADGEKPKFDMGVVAALGVAVGGITTAIGLFLQAIFGLGWLMPLGIIGLMLLISGPSMFIAWLKLRQRNLGPILDASGWAINGHVKINIPFGGQLTQVAKLPKGAKRTLRDPYKKRSVLPTLIISALIGAAIMGGAWYWKTKLNTDSKTVIEQEQTLETSLDANPEPKVD